MQQHNLSTSFLASYVGGRSELKKILAEAATDVKRDRLFHCLIESKLFSPEECQQLERSLEISRIGIDQYRFQQSIRRILEGCPTPTFIPMRIENGSLLSDRLSSLQNADRIEMICINCCFHSLIAALLPLFASAAKEVQMWHLIHANAFANAAASFVGVTFPLLFDSRYLPYGLDVPVGGDVQAVGGNVLAIRAFFGAKEQQYFFMIMDDMCAIELPNAYDAHSFSFLGRVLKSLSPLPFPLKEAPSSNEDYTQLCMNYLSHELNRATYSITNDLLFHQTPTEIAIASLSDKGTFSIEDIRRLIRRTAAIHEQRYQNQYCKKKDTYRIMTYAGCERFLKTGLYTDHFFGFRAFTPKERKQIFYETIANAQKNPHFIPLLIKDHNFQCRCNLVCYDKLGVSLDMADTDYNIEKGNRSVFLMFPEFTRQYMDYYLTTLVQENCHTPQESLELLCGLYDRFAAENP